MRSRAAEQVASTRRSVAPGHDGRAAAGTPVLACCGMAGLCAVVLSFALSPVSMSPDVARSAYALERPTSLHDHDIVAIFRHPALPGVARR